MGRVSQMYVGPVAIFDKIPKTFEIEKSTEPSCVNESCKRYNLIAKNTKHCSECGCMMGSRLVETKFEMSSEELLEDTEFKNIFMILNQSESFNNIVAEVDFLDEVIVIGAHHDDKLADLTREIDNYTEVLFYNTFEEISDMMRRFADKYVAPLDEYVSILGPYKLVWSSNITES